MQDFVQWTSTLSVGVADMDAEHRRLVDVLNRLYLAMREGKGRDVLDGLFDELVEYTRLHFANEEQLMTAHGFPGFEAHRAEHVRLTREVQQRREAYEAGRMGVAVDLFDFLKDWLVEHIQGRDREYGRFLNGRGLGQQRS